MTIAFPTTSQLMTYLRKVRSYAIAEIGDLVEVRLQVFEDSNWTMHEGDSSYDLDHSGYWGAASVAPDDTDEGLLAIAQELIEQAEEQAEEQAAINEM